VNGSRDSEASKPRRPANIGARRALARLSLFWEQAWPVLWPPLGIAGAFLVLALLDVFAYLPGWLHALVILAVAAISAHAAWRAVRALHWPSTGQATRRLETDSGLAHRPLTTIDDRPALGMNDPAAERLWQIHLARAAVAARQVHLRLPHPNLAARDPFALRILLAVALVVAVFAAGDRAETRLTRAVTPDLSSFGQTDTASLELWITPPNYTNQPPRLLASADPKSTAAPGPGETGDAAAGPIRVPVGSKLLAQVNGGGRIPVLVMGENSTEMEQVSETAWRIETTLDTVGSQTVAIGQSRNSLGEWPLEIVADTPPDITFSGPPAPNDSHSLVLGYDARDDYGVTEVRAAITWPGAPPAAGIENLDLELPLPRPDPREGAASSLHDLTAHPWAGLEVDVQLTATDGRGQTGKTDRLSVILPEREFRHPVAREIVAQRRVLALSPENRRDVARSLHNIGAVPDRYGNDIAVFLSLMSARSHLLHGAPDESLMPVMSQLWDTALRLEDGSLSLAQRDVARLQEQLREALENGASEEEVQEIMEQLRAALDRYLEALAENLSQALEGMDLSTLPEAGADANLLDRDAIQELLRELEQAARLGDMESVQQMMERLQQMMQALQNAPNMMRQQQSSSPAQQFMRQLQDVLRRQQGLHDDTFQRQQRGEPMSPSESQAARDAQNEIRRQLGELMRQLGEMTNQIPENLGNAENAMSDAERALGGGDVEGALSSQMRALDELRQGGQQMALQFMRQQGPGQGPAEGLAQPGQEGFDPLGRPVNEPGEDAEGFTATGQGRVGEGDQAERALEILDELRARLRDQGRPEAEIDYLLRLLRRF